MANEMKVFITFKESERWIWEILNEKSCKSGYIKDVLKEYLSEQKTKKDEPTSPFIDF